MDLKSIETFHHLSSDHLPVLLRLGPFTGETTNKFKDHRLEKSVDRAEEVDTPSANRNDIVSNKDIDTARSSYQPHRDSGHELPKEGPKSKRRGLPARSRIDKS
ncbi:hypothetical protein EVAR_47864_1 [Eumeta japonica]|uniref:Uncharacterized protein n=1 Tax=Eumeta variegata TaxID=151549 RepID=A0A4C1ZX86_EUMVA|nr:hypothetical protein EVAR_47864_1 [Eumeta japonica]